MAAPTVGTWRATDLVGVGALTDVDTTAAWPLGTRIKAYDMGSNGYGVGEFVYLSGVTSCASGSVCLVTDTWGTSLIAARDKGAVCVALAAVDASTKYGWFQVRGKAVCLSTDSASANLPMYIDAGNSGSIEDAAVAGDQVIGARSVAATDTNRTLVNLTTFPAVADFDNA
jgi:hypothetical protein